MITFKPSAPKQVVVKLPTKAAAPKVSLDLAPPPAPPPPPPKRTISLPRGGVAVATATLGAAKKAINAGAGAKLQVPFPATITPIHAIGLAGAAQSGDANALGWLDGLNVAVASGAPGAAGDLHLMNLATAVQVSAEYVAKWFGQAQADTLLPMAHLTHVGG